MKGMETRTYTTGRQVIGDITHALARTATVDYPNAQVNSEGKKIIKAGTPVGGAQPFPFNDEQTLEPTDGTSNNPSGVLWHDVDVTDGPNAGTVVVRGEAIVSNMDTDVQNMYKVETINNLKNITVSK